MKEQFVKTKMCPYNETGYCVHGEKCSFAHNQNELRPLPDLQKTKLCESVTKGYICRTPNCAYAHTRDDLRSSNDLVAFKTSLCLFYRKGKGRCLNGDKCRFAHGVHELKGPTSENAPSGNTYALNRSQTQPLSLRARHRPDVAGGNTTRSAGTYSLGPASRQNTPDSGSYGGARKRGFQRNDQREPQRAVSSVSARRQPDSYVEDFGGEPGHRSVPNDATTFGRNAREHAVRGNGALSTTTAEFRTRSQPQQWRRDAEGATVGDYAEQEAEQGQDINIIKWNQMRHDEPTFGSPQASEEEEERQHSIAGWPSSASPDAEPEPDPMTVAEMDGVDTPDYLSVSTVTHHSAHLEISSAAFLAEHSFCRPARGNSFGIATPDDAEIETDDAQGEEEDDDGKHVFDDSYYESKQHTVLLAEHAAPAVPSLGDNLIAEDASPFYEQAPASAAVSNFGISEAPNSPAQSPLPSRDRAVTEGLSSCDLSLVQAGPAPRDAGESPAVEQQQKPPAKSAASKYPDGRMVFHAPRGSSSLSPQKVSSRSGTKSCPSTPPTHFQSSHQHFPAMHPLPPAGWPPVHQPPPYHHSNSFGVPMVVRHPSVVHSGSRSFAGHPPGVQYVVHYGHGHGPQPAPFVYPTIHEGTPYDPTRVRLPHFEGIPTNAAQRSQIAAQLAQSLEYSQQSTKPRHRPAVVDQTDPKSGGTKIQHTTSEEGSSTTHSTSSTVTSISDLHASMAGASNDSENSTDAAIGNHQRPAGRFTLPDFGGASGSNKSVDRATSGSKTAPQLIYQSCPTAAPCLFVGPMGDPYPPYGSPAVAPHPQWSVSPYGSPPPFIPGYPSQHMSGSRHRSRCCCGYGCSNHHSAAPLQPPYYFPPLPHHFVDHFPERCSSARRGGVRTMPSTPRNSPPMNYDYPDLGWPMPPVRALPEDIMPTAAGPSVLYPQHSMQGGGRMPPPRPSDIASFQTHRSLHASGSGDMENVIHFSSSSASSAFPMGSHPPYPLQRSASSRFSHHLSSENQSVALSGEHTSSGRRVHNELRGTSPGSRKTMTRNSNGARPAVVAHRNHSHADLVTAAATGKSAAGPISRRSPEMFQSAVQDDTRRTQQEIPSPTFPVTTTTTRDVSPRKRILQRAKPLEASAGLAQLSPKTLAPSKVENASTTPLVGYEDESQQQHNAGSGSPPSKDFLLQKRNADCVTHDSNNSDKVIASFGGSMSSWKSHRDFGEMPTTASRGPSAVLFEAITRSGPGLQRSPSFVAESPKEAKEATFTTPADSGVNLSLGSVSGALISDETGSGCESQVTSSPRASSSLSPKDRLKPSRSSSGLLDSLVSVPEAALIAAQPVTYED